MTRLHRDGPVYIYINRGKRTASGETNIVYTVNGSINGIQYFDGHFSKLVEALAYANGEDGGHLAHNLKVVGSNPTPATKIKSR